jgi:hypothetical protein
VKAALIGVLGGFQGLGWDESREKAIDRLTAIGNIQAATVNRALNTAHMCSLGVDLVAFKFAHRAESRAAAVDGLFLMLKDKQDRLRLSDIQLQRVASWAIHEGVITLCPSCGGKREVPTANDQEGAQPMQACSPCHGTGLRKYSDSERIEAMGDVFARAMYEAHGYIGQAEALAVDQARRMLERW